MALDPSIALQVKPLSIPDPLESYGKVLQLRNMMNQQAAFGQQQQLGAEQLRGAQQENEQKRIQMDQTKAINDAYSSALTVGSDGKPSIDTDKITGALSKGGHGAAIPGILKGITESQKATADLAKTRGEVKVQEADAAGALGATIQDAGGDPHLFLTLTKHAIDTGAVDAGTMGPLIQRVQQQLQADPTGTSAKADLMQISGQLVKSSPKQVQLANEKATADARALQAKTGAEEFALKKPGIEADNTGKRQLITGTQPIQPKDQATINQAKDTAAETAKRDAATAANQSGHLSLEQKKFNATLGAGLDANGRPLSSDEARTAAMGDPVARAIANYQTPPPSSRTSALGMAVMRKVLAIDPNYDATKFPERTKITQDFSASGASGKAMTSTDTALSHLHVLSQAGDAMKTGDIPTLNKLAQFLGAQTGQSPKVTYDSIVAMVAPEISKAVIGAAGGEADRKTMAANFSSSNSDAQREGAIGSTAKLLGARFEKQGQAYQSDMGKPLDRKLSPESQKVLDRYSGSGASSGGVPKAGDTKPYGGRNYTFDGKEWVAK